MSLVIFFEFSMSYNLPMESKHTSNTVPRKQFKRSLKMVKVVKKCFQVIGMAQVLNCSPNWIQQFFFLFMEKKFFSHCLLSSEFLCLLSDWFMSEKIDWYKWRKHKWAWNCSQQTLSKAENGTLLIPPNSCMEAVCKRGGNPANTLNTNKLRKNLKLESLPGCMYPEICLLNTWRQGGL